MNHFLIDLWNAIKSGFYKTTSDNQLSSWMEKKFQSTSQSLTCTKKKVMVPVWWSAASLIHYRFLNPSEPIISDKYAQRCTKNCNTCSWHWSTESNQFFMTVPNCMLYNKHFKNWMHWTLKFCLISHIDLTSFQQTTTSSGICFAGKMLPQAEEDRKCFPRVHWIPMHGFLCYRNK